MFLVAGWAKLSVQFDIRTCAVDGLIYSNPRRLANLGLAVFKIHHDPLVGDMHLNEGFRNSRGFCTDVMTRNSFGRKLCKWSGLSGFGYIFLCEGANGVIRIHGLEGRLKHNFRCRSRI